MSALELEFERLEMALELAFPVGTAKNRELPPEIWKMVLSYLDLDGADLVIYCRLVNRCWRNLANEILRESTSLWNPTFEAATATELVKGRCGIRFSTPDDITRFMLDMEGATNPFPNGTVIFIPDGGLTREKEIAFQDKFCKLLEAFKDAILNLVYIIPVATLTTRNLLGDIDLSHQFRSIMNLKKLKSLVIDIRGNWNDVETLNCSHNQTLFKEMLESSGATLPENLKELHIYGFNGIIPLFYIFGGLEPALKSVSSLEISNCISQDPELPLDERLGILCQFPNLQKLKVRYPDNRYPDSSVLKQFRQFQPNCAASLKEVSLYFESTTALHLKDTFALVDLHAETLELLHFEFGSKPRIFSDQLTGLYSSINYTKLKTFTFYCGKITLDYWPALIGDLAAKLVNLQEVKLILPITRLRRVQTPDPGVFHLQQEQIPKREQYEKVVALWDILSDTVAVIHVPNYGWKLKRGETLQFDEAGNVMEME